MVNKNVLSCLLEDGKEVNAVMLIGRLFHARATVTRNDRSPMVLSRVRGTIRHGQEQDRSRCRDSAWSVQWSSSARYEGPCGYDSRKPVGPVCLDGSSALAELLVKRKRKVERR